MPSINNLLTDISLLLMMGKLDWHPALNLGQNPLDQAIYITKHGEITVIFLEEFQYFDGNTYTVGINIEDFLKDEVQHYFFYRVYSAGGIRPAGKELVQELESHFQEIILEELDSKRCHCPFCQASRITIEITFMEIPNECPKCGDVLEPGEEFCKEHLANIPVMLWGDEGIFQGWDLGLVMNGDDSYRIIALSLEADDGEYLILGEDGFIDPESRLGLQILEMAEFMDITPRVGV